jgi:perosamine synthetase
MAELPALLGGRPACPAGPPAWPSCEPDILEAMQRAHRDGSWGRYHAEHTQALEQWLREYHGVEHAVLCGSGTFAVELALRALRVGPGSEAILAAYDYPGNFLSVHAVGAQPVLVDIDPANWNVGAAALAEAVGPRTRALVVSHLHGGFAPMAEIAALAHERGLAVVEDAAQCPGAEIQQRRAGTWGDVGVFSFGGSKLLTAGRGGALITRHADVWQRARTFLVRGNVTCPLSELQAAVLLPQCRRLDAANRRRLDNVRRLQELLAGLPGLAPFANRVAGAAAYYKLGFRYDAARFGLARARLVEALRAEGVALEAGFAAAHVGRSPRRYRCGSALDEAERAHHGCVVLHHPVLQGSAADVEAVAHAWHKVHVHAERLQEVRSASEG